MPIHRKATYWTLEIRKFKHKNLCGVKNWASFLIRNIPFVCVYMYISEKAMAPHSSTLAWKIPWTEEHGRLQSMGREESDMTEGLHFHFSLSCTGEGNGNPLQCSCLENPRDGGAWWAAVYGVTQSRTWLKRLSSKEAMVERSSLSWWRFPWWVRTPGKVGGEEAET